MEASAAASADDVNVTAADESSASPPDDTVSQSVPPSSTSMGDHSRPASRPTSADQGEDESGRTMSPMSYHEGPDAESTDLGFDKPPPPSKTAGCDDLFKKPDMDQVDSIPLGQMGGAAGMKAAGAARVDPMSWTVLLYDYSQGTTMHGLPYITRGARFVVRRSAAFQSLGSSDNNLKNCRQLD